MKVQKQSILATMVLALVVALAAGPVAGAATRGDALAAVSNLGDQMAWVSNGGAEHLTLRVSGPGTHFAQRFNSGDPAVFNLFDERGNARPDGAYTWELREIAGPANDRVRDEANGRDTAAHDGDRRAEFPGRLQWGSFTIKNGAVVDSNLEEAQAGRPTKD